MRFAILASAPLNIFSVSVLANDSITPVYYHAMILSSSTLSELQIYFGVVIVRITKKRKRDSTKRQMVTKDNITL